MRTNLSVADPTAAAGFRELVTFHLAGQEFGLEIRAVREIRGWAPVSPIPEAPPHVMGVVDLRGTVLPIVDLASRLGFASAQPSARSAIIVVEAQEGPVGLLVEGVSEILAVSSDAIQPTPGIASGGFSCPIQGLILMGDRMITLLVLESLVGPAHAEAA